MEGEFHHTTYVTWCAYLEIFSYSQYDTVPQFIPDTGVAWYKQKMIHYLV